MVTKRNPIGPTFGTLSKTAQMKYRPMETGRQVTKGTKLAASPRTVSEILTQVIVHGCKKILYIDPKVRVLAYVTILFFVSLITDYMPMPRTYFSNTQNIFNQLFVKFSWGWTLSFVCSYMLLTTAVYCCGDKKRIARHSLRLLVATLIWYIWTTLFTTIEETTGTCLYINSPGSSSDIVYSKSRRSCLKSNGKWTSFDISGHSFLLIWCAFFIIEESRPIIGWDLISDHIREEDHKRSKTNTSNNTSEPDPNDRETPLSCLTAEEFTAMKLVYPRHSIWAKVCLIFLTFLVLVWDWMLLMTACYFHIMIEKVLGGFIALLMWRMTYGWLYKINGAFSPGLPGHGRFKYSNLQFGSSSTRTTTAPAMTRSNPAKLKTKDGEEIPTFMGMPLWALRNKKDGTNEAPRNIVTTK